MPLWLPRASDGLWFTTVYETENVYDPSRFVWSLAGAETDDTTRSGLASSVIGAAVALLLSLDSAIRLSVSVRTMTW